MATKTPNYTTAQTAALVSAYEDCETQAEREACVKEYAESFGKNAQSIRAKLVSEGVYVKKEYATKTGAKPESKTAIVTHIALLLGVPGETVESLEKANKKALNLVRGTLFHARKALAEREESPEEGAS